MQFGMSRRIKQKEKYVHISMKEGARCGSVVRAFAHGAVGHRIDP